MPFKVSTHVDRMNRFLPFSPSHDQIYEEYQLTEDSLNLDTRALSYALQAASGEAELIILTGDAGHGKTHLCRRLIQEHLGYPEGEARALINEKCDGSQVIQHRDGTNGVRGLRIFKDFSELQVEAAASKIENLRNETDAVTLICANEGRLRDVLASSQDSPVCSGLLDDFNESFQDGLARRAGKIHIINLNYQSVSSSKDGRSLVIEALHQWTSGSRWRTCTDCDAREGCPILANQVMLSSRASEVTEVRRQRVETILSATERLGTVVTIREMLMIVAYMLTSGLTCKEVHSRFQKRERGWQHRFIYYNNLFELSPNLTPDKLQRIPVLAELAKLDPGVRSSRNIDERIVNEQEIFPHDEIDLQFPSSTDRNAGIIDAANGIDEIIGNPRNRKERFAEAAFVQSVVRSLRRRAFFDAVQADANPLQLLGFDEGAKFSEIIEGGLSPKRYGELKRNIIAGLHTIQGLQLGESTSELNLVEPAFGDATSHAAIIADTVPVKDIDLIPLAQKWDLDTDVRQFSISESVDWLDRYIALRIRNKDGGHSDLLLDLVSFDCIVRAGGGYVAEKFYAHDIRRITSFLGQLAEARSSTSDKITLFYEGALRSVSIDDGVIQVSN
jgi:hypothetical protein